MWISLMMSGKKVAEEVESVIPSIQFSKHRYRYLLKFEPEKISFAS